MSKNLHVYSATSSMNVELIYCIYYTSIWILFDFYVCAVLNGLSSTSEKG